MKIFNLFIIMIMCSSFAIDSLSQISTGLFTSSFLCEDGKVMIIGESEDSNFGDTLKNTGIVRTPHIIDLPDIVGISSGAMHSLHLTSDGKVYGFGDNVRKQLSSDMQSTVLGPTLIPNLPIVTQVAATTGGSRFLDEFGVVHVLGHNVHGELGPITVGLIGTLTQLTGLDPIASIAGEALHSLLLTTEGEVYSCGRNTEGQLGIGTLVHTDTPTKIPNLPPIAYASGSKYHSLFVDINGKVWGCGSNINGQLGLPSDVDYISTPQLLFESEEIVFAAAGEDHSLLATNSGDVYVTGSDEYGQLGLEDETNLFSFKSLQLVDIEKVFAGVFVSYLIDRQGVIHGAGIASRGLMSDEAETELLTFTEINSLCKVIVSHVESEAHSRTKGIYLSHSTLHIGHSAQGLDIRIYNTGGSLVDQHDNYQSNEVDLSKLSNGVYFVSLVEEGNLTRNQMITLHR